MHDDVIKWKHFRGYWSIVRGIRRSSVNSPHKGHWRVALMFTLICARISGWVNSCEAGDLRRRRAHYDVTVMVHGCDRLKTNGNKTQQISLGDIQFMFICCLCLCIILESKSVYRLTAFVQSVHVRKTCPFLIVIMHDDVIKWEHFPRYWWIPHTKASDAELWCFLWSASE